MTIAHFVAWLGCAWILIQSCHTSPVNHPTLNFTQLGYLGIAGSYQGISFYTDTRQLTTIPPSTASLVSYSKQTFELLASSSTNGSVYATCVLSLNSVDTLYVAGEFTHFGSVRVSNIAQIDLTTNTITALSQGLDGPVYSVLCDSATNSVYVGGSFLAPISEAPLYSASLSKFGGSVAVWANKAWEALPWKGLDGPVYAITKNQKTNSIMFGGRFGMTRDGQGEFEPDSQPINLGALSTVSATNSDTVYNDPTSVLCPSEKSTPWHLKAGQTGTWDVYFSLSVTPSLIRLANTFVKDSGVKNFSILSLSTNTYFNLSYIDPLTLRTQTCSQCQLTQSSKLEFQDFRILDSSITYGLKIEIASWYGSGGGLAGVQIYQSEIFVHAVQDLNFPTCASSSPEFGAKAVAVGTWKESVPTGSYQHILSTSVPANKLKDSPPSVDFIPNLPESGSYQVMLYTPGCGNNAACQQRTHVDLTIYTAPNKTTVVTVYQNNTADTTISIYNGYFAATSLEFAPHITLSANTPGSGNTVTVVANAVQWIKSASMSGISSVLEYKPSQTDGTALLSWASLTETLPAQSIVRALDATDGDLYIGGTFTTISGSTGYQNMVRFGQTSKKLEPLQSAGLDGPVNAFLRSGSDLYIGGNFKSSQSDPAVSLANVAIYKTATNAWAALGGGVNGPVYSLQFTDNEKAILVSGEFTYTTGKTNSLARQSTGNSWWNMSTTDWSMDRPLLSGTIYGAFELNDKKSTYYIGSIDNAQQFQSQGLSFIDSSLTISSLPFYPDATKPAKISAGALWKNPLNDSWATIVAGSFELNNIHNTAIYDNGVWSGLGSDWKGNVTSMIVHDNYLYMSGEFDADDLVAANFAVYDLVDQAFIHSTGLQNLDGKMAKVNVMHPNSIASGIVVGGDFVLAGTVTCKGVCAFNPLDGSWTSFGDGISGTVNDMTFTEATLVVTGSLKISDATVSMAEYNYQTSQWSSSIVLPGPCSALSYDDHTKQTYFAGQNSSSTYLGIWDGSQFTVTNASLGPGSVVSQMTTVSISESPESSLKARAVESDEASKTNSQILLVSGILNLGQYGNVSAALFDGAAWIPYMVSSSVDGSVTGLGSMFFNPYDITVLLKRYLSQGLVIFISVVAGFGIVSVIIVIALSMLYLMRRKENNVSPSANPLGYYGKPPRSPQSLIDMLESDKDPKRGSIGTYFDSRFSTMSRNGLTGREMMQTATSFGASTDGLSSTSTYVMPPQIKQVSEMARFDHIRPDSSVRPQSELHRMSDYSTFNGYGEPMEPITNSNYNPFRASAIGIAVTADQPNGHTNTNDYVPRNSTLGFQSSTNVPINSGPFGTPGQVTGNSVAFSSIAPATSAASFLNSGSAAGSAVMVPVHTAGQAVLFGSVATATVTAGAVGIAMSGTSKQTKPPVPAHAPVFSNVVPNISEFSTRPDSDTFGSGHAAIFGNISPGSTGRGVQVPQTQLNGQHVTFDTPSATASRGIVSGTGAPYGTPSPSVDKFVSRPLPHPQADSHMATFGNIVPAAASAAVINSITTSPKQNDQGQSALYTTIAPSVGTANMASTQSRDISQAASFGNIAPVKSTMAMSTAQSEIPFGSTNSALYSTISPPLFPVAVESSPQSQQVGQSASYGNIAPATANMAIGSSAQSHNVGQPTTFGTINPSTATMVIGSSAQPRSVGQPTTFGSIVPAVAAMAVQSGPLSHGTGQNVSFGTVVPLVNSTDSSTPQKKYEVGENSSFGNIPPTVAIIPPPSQRSYGEKHAVSYNDIEPTTSTSQSQKIGQPTVFSSIEPTVETMTISSSMLGDDDQRISYLDQSHQTGQAASFGTVRPDISTTEIGRSTIQESHNTAIKAEYGMIPAASASVGSVGLDKYNNNNRGLENSSKSSKSVGNAADSTSSIPRSQAQNKTVNASANPFATAVVGIAASKEIESKSQESVKSHNNVTLADSKPNSTSLHPSPPNLDAQSSTVRWTNAGIDNGAIGQAMVVPIVVAQDDNDVNTNKEPKSSRAISHQSLAPNSEQVEPSSVRWTNYSTSGALGTTRIDNSTMSMYSDHFSIYNPLGDNLAPLQDPISEGFASDPDFSRWTNSGLDQDHGKLDEEKNNKNQENSRQPFVEKDKESEDDEDDQKERRSTGVSSYQAGLDHTSMVWREDLDTLFRNSQNSYSGFQGIGQTDGENNSDSESDSEQKMASAASGKKANIYNQTPQQEPSRKSPLMDIMAASEANKTKQVNDSPKKVLDGEIISSSAFDVDSARNSTRWSNIAGLPPINTSFTGPLEHLTPKSAASLESPSLRWKVAQIASPVETAHAPIVTESFADIHNVTDQPDALYDSESDSEFGDIPSTVNPVKARMVSAVNLAKTSGAEINPVRAEKSPIGTSGSSGAKNVSKTPSVLSPLSGQMFSPTSTGPHTQMGALDGRAASRRMVEEYFSTRESIIPAPAPPPPTDKKIKHRSDFRSVMEMAIINNKDGRPPSEDHPHLYYAKFDFNAREVGELGFDKGDPVIVVDSSDDIWWVGYKDGGDDGLAQGVFPSNYIERADSSVNPYK